METLQWERIGGRRGPGRLANAAGWPIRKLAGLQRLRRACHNWIQVAAFRARLRRSVEVRFRFGPTINLTDRSQLPAALNGEAWNLALLAAFCPPLALDDGGVSFQYHGRRVRFEPGRVRQSYIVLKEQFVDELYQWLEVRGRDVLDVGGSVGDSAVYFALNGARRVLVLEPYPGSFSALRANVAANQLGSVITPLCAGAGRDGNVTVSTDTASISAALRESSRGVTVPTYSLGTLLKQWDWADAVAKVDCEGGEYPLLLDASDRDLRKFRQYFVEYHRGHQELCSRLREAGFDVWYTPRGTELDTESGQTRELGLLRALRRN